MEGKVKVKILNEQREELIAIVDVPERLRELVAENPVLLPEGLKKPKDELKNVTSGYKLFSASAVEP